MLNTLTFGSPAAERDQNLIEYFVERESFVRLRDGSKTIALGNRGAGKTAIFRMLAEHVKQKGTHVIQMSPENYSYELLSGSMLDEAQGAWAKQSAYTAAWNYQPQTIPCTPNVPYASRYERGNIRTRRLIDTIK